MNTNIDKDTNIKIQKYYVNIVMNKPAFIEVINSYERFCVYMALEQYAHDWQTVWCNKSHKKEPVYANQNTCKFCFKKKRISEIKEWEQINYESYFGGEFHYYCKTCNDPYANVWEHKEFMFINKNPYKINIYYEQPIIKIKKFEHKS